MRARAVAAVVLSALTVASASCGKKSRPRGGQSEPQAAVPGEAPGGGTKSATPFLSSTKDVPARMEWNRDFGSRKGGTVAFRVTSTAPFGVTVVTDKAYQAIKGQAGSKLNPADVLLTVDAKPPAYEGRLTVPPGMAWFIIENQSDAPATIGLECFEVK